MTNITHKYCLGTFRDVCRKTSQLSLIQSQTQAIALTKVRLESEKIAQTAIEQKFQNLPILKSHLIAQSEIDRSGCLMQDPSKIDHKSPRPFTHPRSNAVVCLSHVIKVLIVTTKFLYWNVLDWLIRCHTSGKLVRYVDPSAYAFNREKKMVGLN